MGWSMVCICRNIPEIEIVEVNTDDDHVHLLLSIPPKLTVSEVVKMLKAKTGLYMRKKFPFLDKIYWGRGDIWSTGYFVPTVGMDEETRRKYVQMQSEEDSVQAKL